MNPDGPSTQPQRNGRHFALLERVTAAVLLLVVVALGWVLLAAYQPAMGEMATQVQVIIILVLLTVALVLVSIVALLHTR